MIVKPLFGMATRKRESDRARGGKQGKTRNRRERVLTIAYHRRDNKSKKEGERKRAIALLNNEQRQSLTLSQKPNESTDRARPSSFFLRKETSRVFYCFFRRDSMCHDDYVISTLTCLSPCDSYETHRAISRAIFRNGCRSAKARGRRRRQIVTVLLQLEREREKVAATCQPR